MTGSVQAFGQQVGQGWEQIGDLAIALVLSSIIGLERELRDKAAGLRTQTVVGLGAALFVLVSKYGFFDVINGHGVILDPSRIAAQIVSGIGFVGAGLIFVERGSVRGLTTASVVWLSAAVGAAAGAGLPVLAAVATGGYLLIVLGYTPLTRRLRPRSDVMADAADGSTGHGTAAASDDHSSSRDEDRLRRRR